jgi:hypothetical protein
MESAMSFCEHCQWQRFDRAQVLRALRQLRNELRGKGRARNVDEALAAALRMVAALEIPHLDLEDAGGEMIH